MIINLDLSDNQLRILHSAINLYSQKLEEKSKEWYGQNNVVRCSDAALAKVQVQDILIQLALQLKKQPI